MNKPITVSSETHRKIMIASAEQRVSAKHIVEHAINAFFETSLTKEDRGAIRKAVNDKAYSLKNLDTTNIEKSRREVRKMACEHFDLANIYDVASASIDDLIAYIESIDGI